MLACSKQDATGSRQPTLLFEAGRPWTAVLRLSLGRFPSGTVPNLGQPPLTRQVHPA